MRHFTAFMIVMALVAAFAFSASQSMAAGHPVSTTVSDAKASDVDTDVQLQGRVTKHINDNEYLFDDGTGELLVYITDPAQQTLAANGQNVEIKGNIVRNFMYTEVQAESVSAR